MDLSHGKRAFSHEKCCLQAGFKSVSIMTQQEIMCRWQVAYASKTIIGSDKSFLSTTACQQP